MFRYTAEQPWKPLRNAIETRDRYSSRAFVSTRAMVSMRDTYIAYRINKEQKNPIPNAIADPRYNKPLMPER